MENSEKLNYRRPRLDDPEEFALIRSMYFEGRETKEPVDSIESLERMNSKQINQSKSSR